MDCIPQSPLKADIPSGFGHWDALARRQEVWVAFPDSLSALPLHLTGR